MIHAKEVDMDFMTVQEFADAVKMCRHTIIRAIKHKKIYAFRPGSGKKSPYRIPKTELERIQLAGMYEEKK